jgi:hypothetical protein
MYYALLVAAAFGAARLRARPGDLLVLATPVLVASVAGLLTWGLVRLRHEGEVSILVLAGVGLSDILARLGRGLTALR